MPMPKSVTKINKDGVHFISSVEKVDYTIAELSKAALRDVSKLLKRIIKNDIAVYRGVLKSNVASWVRKDRVTGQIELQIGIYDRKQSIKKGKTPAIHAHFLEFGTRSMPAQPFLTPAVTNNIKLIRDIQSKYLSAIENESKAIGLIEEGDEISDES